MDLIRISEESFQESKNLFEGVYHPLSGFLNKPDLVSVLDKMKLVTGEVWPMPILLDVDEELDGEGQVTLVDPKGNKMVLEDVGTYRFSKKEIAKKLYGTDSVDHPGVVKIMEMKKYFLSGKPIKIELKTDDHPFYLSPEETREIFRKNQWDEVVAFQTRNPPHLSHEHIQRLALSRVAALMIHPIIGGKKSGDFLDEHIIGSYRILIEKYYPKNQTHLGTFHSFMRYAGPKEALFHALVRRNFGCTHMIIGRDHAGVGGYYGRYDAHSIFDCFKKEELGIEIMRFKNMSYCPRCDTILPDGSCDHPRLKISGTKLRDMIVKGETIDDNYLRPEISKYLNKNKRSLFYK